MGKNIKVFNYGWPKEMKFSEFDFPDGQPHIKFEDKVLDDVLIKCRLTNPHDLFDLMLICETLKRAGNTKTKRLHISYLMGARMDRAISDLEPWTLNVVTGIINSLEFDEIQLFDVHSEVAVALLGATNLLSAPFVDRIIDSLDKTNLIFVAPDAGASKRVETLARGLPIVQCLKHRDPETGKLSNFSMHTLLDLKGKDFLIVDDICDGGGTFIPIAKFFLEAGAKSVGLYVSHGIFSKGLPIEGINHIWTTNSYKNHENTDYLTVFNTF